MEERNTRSVPRFTVRILAEMQIKDTERTVCHPGHIATLSERGAFIEAPGDHSLGSQVMLRFGFPLIDDIICMSVVRDTLAAGIGVEFLRLSASERARLAGLASRNGQSSWNSRPLSV